MRFGPVIMAYFMIGVVMWGGGVIGWTESGVGQEFVNPQGDQVTPNNETAEQLERTGGVVDQAAQSLAGPVILVWNLVTNFIKFLFWPVTTLQAVNAPPQLVVLSAALSVGFFVALIGLLGRIS
jgi:hypothetical protein